RRRAAYRRLTKRLMERAERQEDERGPDEYLHVKPSASVAANALTAELIGRQRSGGNAQSTRRERVRRRTRFGRCGLRSRCPRRTRRRALRPWPRDNPPPPLEGLPARPR